VLVKAASLAVLAVHDPVFPGCNRTPTCSIRFRSASSPASGRALDGSTRGVRPRVRHAANQRITEALSTPEADQEPSDKGDADSESAA
jgi:hypothetical protein